MVRENLFLINAPAGSGKTFFIKEEINKLLARDSNSRILCITYTERAANELKSRVNSETVEISKIHSFMNSFLSPFFSLSEVIDFFIATYRDKISSDISEDSNSRIQRYRKRMGIDDSVELTIDQIRKNINKVYYNELPYNLLLYGGISHDELLSFSFNLIDNYPIIKMKAREMYQYIFIDEVQDTSSEVLNFFYYSVKNSNTRLYVFGDKMQEIYDNYDGSFEDKFREFDKSLSNNFKKNYRSSEEILTTLRHLYKSENYIEQKSEKGLFGVKPKIILCCVLQVKSLELCNEKFRTLPAHIYINDLIKRISLDNYLL